MNIRLLSTLQELLNENRLQHLIQTYTAKEAKTPINEKALWQIIVADPTTKPKDAASLQEVQKVGEYAQWIIKQYLKIAPKKDPQTGKLVADEATQRKVHLFFEDLYKTTEALEKFHIMKQRHKLPEDKKDINKVVDGVELRNLTRDFNIDDALVTKAEKKQQYRQDVDLLYEDERYEVMTPKTWEASHELFGPPLTDWCTAASEGRGRGYFQDYSSKGPLYSIRDKSQIVKGGGKGEGMPRPILQVHFPDEQFMDPEDMSVDFAEFLGDKPGLKKFFHPIFKKALSSIEFDLEKELYQWYIKLYGAGEDIKRIAEESIQQQVTSKTKELKVVDEGTSRTEVNIKNYVSVFGSYDATLEKVFQYMNTSLSNFEIKLKRYSGSGMVIPEKIGELTNLTLLVLSGGVRQLPDIFGHLTNLTTLVLNKNPQLKQLPPSIASCELLTVLNIQTTAVELSPQLQQKEDEDLIVIR